MKNKYILLVIASLIFASIACKKENNSTIIGKWQEVKIRIYTTAPDGVIVNDTIYSARTLTDLNYVQFNTNSTCVIATDYIYYPAYVGTVKISAITPTISTYSYRIIKYKSVLIAYSLFPGSNYTTDTAVFMNAKTLLIHSVYYPYNPFSAIASLPQKTISDSYYSR
ncbi:MAG TPA: hypothetical protein VIM16_22020 [Mucilaginibacter sp.]|jgi:hypothetical protein